MKDILPELNWEKKIFNFSLVFLRKFSENFEKEMKDFTKAIERNEEKLLKIRKLLDNNWKD